LDTLQSFTGAYCKTLLSSHQFLVKFIKTFILFIAWSVQVQNLI